MRLSLTKKITLSFVGALVVTTILLTTITYFRVSSQSQQSLAASVSSYNQLAHTPFQFGFKVRKGVLMPWPMRYRKQPTDNRFSAILFKPTKHQVMT